MPTRSEPHPNEEAGEADAPREEWAARMRGVPASIFDNYGQAVAEPPTPETGAQSGNATAPGCSASGPVASSEVSLQNAIDTAMARSFIYRFLAQAYADPVEEEWTALSAIDSKQRLGAAVAALSGTPCLAESARVLQSQLQPELYGPFWAAYLACFGHAARGRCPLNELEYGDLKADGLFQPHRLADLAAFYRAFGLEVGEGTGERHDHIGIELEFMCVLAAKEAYALEYQLDNEELAICRQAQNKFLREHLGRWTPALARRLGQMTGANPLGALADFTCAFIEAEAAGFGFAPGSEDLVLRPLDEAAERLCQSCGLAKPPAESR